jgi:glyoxylase-like metal-dependent hydrolase (beta-lactamase superfamily II)
MAHLVLEPDLSLIDCGFRGSRGPIARAIEAEGRSMSELARVICTHGHPDHAGSARALALEGVNLITRRRQRARDPLEGSTTSADASRGDDTPAT